MNAARTAPLVELFCSIQGEGRFVGVPMAFVRVARCPIRCRYCDTPYSYTAAPEFTARVGGASARHPNPIDGAAAAELAAASVRASAFAAARPMRVSITGGEPLLYPAFVRELGDAFRAAGGCVHLETALLDERALAAVLPALDHLSADYKLPETLAGGRDHGDRHVRSLELAAATAASIDVKIVLTPDVPSESLAHALDRLAPFRARIVVVLQPVTPFGAVRGTVAPAALAAAARLAFDRGFDVRVLPQVHKALGVD
jgi:organic radical activating enzyme